MPSMLGNIAVSGNIKKKHMVLNSDMTKATKQAHIHSSSFLSFLLLRMGCKK